MTFADHFRQLATFSGRERRSEFWPWTAAVISLTFVILAVSMAGSINAVFEMTPPDFSAMFASLGACIVLTIVFLAAAVARRLRDAGWSPVWGLIPVPFAIFSALTFPRMMMNFGHSSEPDMDLFMAVFISNALYNAALLFLIVLLVLPSRQPKA